jgi:hypothetical protein
MALRYFVNGGLNNSWNQTGAQSNWSLTPGGAGGQTVPSASDDVIFDASSPACTLTGAATCLSFNASTYGTKTWALGTNNISVALGSFTLGTGMTVTGTGTLIKTNAGTLTSNGVTWPGSVQTTANTTYTWGDAWTISGSFTSTNNAAFNGAFNITIGGSFTQTNLTSTSTTYILNGTGSLNGVIAATAIIINTAFTITLPTSLLISGGILRLTSGTVNVTSGHLLQPSGCTLDTDRTSTGGNKISFFNYASINSGPITLQSNLTVTNNFTNANNITTVGVFNINVGGNYAQTGTIIGTARLILDGTANATIGTGTIGIDLTINKSGAGVVTPSSTMSWGAANKTLTINSSVNFAANSNTLGLGAGPLTIVNNFPANSFFNLTIPGIILNINGATMQVAGTLLCTGGVTFAGAYGWTTNNFSCNVASAVIRLQNITQFTSAEYTVNGLLNLVGTLANRLILESSGRANFNGSIATAVPPAIGSTMTLSAPPSTGTIVNGMTVSQATGQIPPGLAPFINDRPTIVSGGSLSWVLNKLLTTRVPTPNGTINLAAGFKAKFTLANNGTSSQNVVYVGTQDIDSSYGKAIFVTGSNGDDMPTDVALFRTLNWGPLVVQSGSVYYTFIN